MQFTLVAHFLNKGYWIFFEFPDKSADVLRCLLYPTLVSVNSKYQFRILVVDSHFLSGIKAGHALMDDFAEQFLALGVTDSLIFTFFR